MQDGSRAPIEWTPIKVSADIRRSSYENKTGPLSHIEVQQRASQLVIGNIECKKMDGKPSNIFEDTPNRYTQVTRDTNAGISNAYDHP